MAQPALATLMTRQEYFAWEFEQPEKHEYWRGEVFAMVGVRQSHAIVAGNCFALLKAHLRGSGCRAYISDVMLEVERADAVFYPDVMVSCEPSDLAAVRVLRQPKVIIEVLSDSTAAFDRGAKFAAYRQLDSLQEYVLIDPERPAIEIFRRTDGGDWLLAVHDAEQGLVLRSLDFSASWAEVFEDLPLG